jgi:hypothetical protein
MKRNIRLSLILPFAAALPLAIIALNEQYIREHHGDSFFELLLLAFILLIFTAAFYPFIKIFKGLAGQKGYRMFWGKGKYAARILETGQQGMATVLGLAETRGGIVTINEQPVLQMALRIETPKGRLYEVEFELLMPRAALPRFQPGAVFPVRIDPENENHVVFDKKRYAAMPSHTIAAGDWSAEEREKAGTEAKKALATLAGIEDSGASVNFRPVVKILFDIHIMDEDMYRIEKEMPMKGEMAGKLRDAVGKTFNARVHPYDRNKVLIDIDL